ncbi:MAG: PASTA domain-containing protein [Deltaproteobacteria bacterium]|nr:PASTA domain-containing protein [Deltaproteobacteria bacterium]
MILRIAKTTALFAALVLIAGVSSYFTLTLLIKSEDTVVVPDLNGKDVVYALKFLTDIGLNTKVKGSEFSAVVPENHVLFQDPEPGTEIKKGRDVKIILSKGAKTVFTPNLEGLSIQQARIILEENDLRQGEVSRTFSRSVAKENIIAQFPSSGVVITRGSKVDLLVSTGDRPRTYKMPDLAGLSIEEAILVIETGTLTLGQIQALFHRGIPKDVVAGQEPLSGYPVTEGSPVNIVVNRKLNENERKDPKRENGFGLFRYRLDSGFLKRHIRVILTGFGVSMDLFNDYIKPGEEIWLIIPRKDNALLLLYEDGKLIKTEQG